jgi:hypothetical protein
MPWHGKRQVDQDVGQIQEQQLIGVTLAFSRKIVYCSRVGQ